MASKAIWILILSVLTVELLQSCLAIVEPESTDEPESIDESERRYLWKEFRHLDKELGVNIAPDRLLRVYFDGKRVPLGGKIAKNLTVHQPELYWDDHWSRTKKQTVLMFDPDAPSPEKPTFQSYLHWVNANITNGHLNSGTTAAPYVNPQPPAGSAPHRYVILVFEHREPLQFQPPSSRMHFDVATFVRSARFPPPFAGSYFKVAGDPL